MGDMQMEYTRIHARAKKLASQAPAAGKRLDADDLTQQTFERFYEKGLDSRVEPTRGTALMLLHRVLFLVYLETLRAESRQCRLRTQPVSERVQRDPLSDVIERERMAFIRVSLSGDCNTLTERERMALVRVYCSLFDECASEKANGNDSAAACRARQKLRRIAERLGLLDEP